MKSLLLSVLIPFTVMAASFAQSNVTDQDAIKKILNAMEQGWNEKNGQLFASGFDTEHDYIVWNGLYFQNMSREDNARSHQGLFDGVYKNTTMRLIADNIEFVREDLAMVYALGAVYDKGTPAPNDPEVLITMLMEKDNGEWKVIAFHNSDIEISFAPGEQTGPIPPQQMFKTWYQKS